MKKPTKRNAKFRGYYAHHPDTYATRGRFRLGHEYPERVATQFGAGNYRGYPNREAYFKAQEDNKERKEMERKEKERKDSIKQEARDIQDIAREFSEEAMRIAMEIARSENATDSAKLQAIDMIHNRAYGKAPVTTINTNLNSEIKPSEINATDLDQRIATALSRVERLTNREAKEGPGEERPINLRQYN